MIGQMVIAIVFPGLNYLGRMGTPVFLLMDHFLYQFSALSKKNERNLSTKSLIFFCKIYNQILFFLTLRTSVRRFRMPFEGLRFVKTLVNFGMDTHLHKIRLKGRLHGRKIGYGTVNKVVRTA